MAADAKPITFSNFAVTSLLSPSQTKKSAYRSRRPVRLIIRRRPARLVFGSDQIMQYCGIAWGIAKFRTSLHRS